MGTVLNVSCPSLSLVPSWITRDAAKRGGLRPPARRGMRNVENRDAVTRNSGSGAVDRSGVLAVPGTRKNQGRGRTWEEGRRATRDDEGRGSAPLPRLSSFPGPSSFLVPRHSWSLVIPGPSSFLVPRHSWSLVIPGPWYRQYATRHNGATHDPLVTASQFSTFLIPRRARRLRRRRFAASLVIHDGTWNEERRHGSLFTHRPSRATRRTAATPIPTSVTNPPMIVPNRGTSRILGSTNASTVAPTGSPSTVRFTTYAGR